VSKFISTPNNSTLTTLKEKLQIKMMNSQFNNQTLAFQPQLQMISVPQVIPPVQMIPQIPSVLPPYQLLGQTALNQPVKFFDASTRSVVDAIPMNLMPTLCNNQLIAPIGYSFVLMNVPQQQSETVTVSASPESIIDSGSVCTERSLSVPPVTISRQATPEPVCVENKPRKYKHRSKQEKIEQVHAEVKAKYQALGLYASEDEVLRGFDTVRVHVKTFPGLCVINQPLDKIMASEEVEVLKIANPVSMKNKFQKKGFIVYLKLAHESQVPIVQSIFREFQEYFPKCDIALKKEDKLRLDAEKAQQSFSNPTFLSQKEGMDFDKMDWDDAWALAPPSMTRNGSLSSMAA
jgi:hypothetical protein